MKCLCRRNVPCEFAKQQANGEIPPRLKGYVFSAAPMRHRESTASPFRPFGCLERHAFIGPTARAVYEADQGSNLLLDSHPDAGGAHVWQDRRVFGCLADGRVTLYTAAGQQKITH